MNAVVSCICGEHIEVEAGEGSDAVDCPTCGRSIEGDRWPGTVALSTEALFDRPEEETGPTIVCPNCDGEGRCPVCVGRSSQSLLGWLMDLIDATLDIVARLMLDLIAAAFDLVCCLLARNHNPYGDHFLYAQDRSIGNRHIRLTACAGCNGNRKCYKCRGTGSCAGPG